ncbi:MAG: hypothetical protein C4527_20750 [Candidatus Omnitrophota bacterium]|nr:MAG: hypothetical protein C4527_20750 [Candidatus Omnitrophota bacterium]
MNYTYLYSSIKKYTSILTYVDFDVQRLHRTLILRKMGKTCAIKKYFTRHSHSQSYTDLRLSKNPEKRKS